MVGSKELRECSFILWLSAAEVSGTIKDAVALVMIMCVLSRITLHDEAGGNFVCFVLMWTINMPLDTVICLHLVVPD